MLNTIAYSIAKSFLMIDISLNKNGPTFTENIVKKIKNILHNFASIQVYLKSAPWFERR